MMNLKERRCGEHRQVFTVKGDTNQRRADNDKGCKKQKQKQKNRTKTADMKPDMTHTGKIQNKTGNKLNPK